MVIVADGTLEAEKRIERVLTSDPGMGVLRHAGIRVQVDERNEKMQAKIRDAQRQQIPYMVVAGEREAAARTVAVRHRREGDVGTMGLELFAKRLVQESTSRQST